MFYYKHILLSLLATFIILFNSCSTPPSITVESKIKPIDFVLDNKQLEKKIYTTLTLTFSGDIMAHSVNFNMKDYNKIYSDVQTILKQDDFSFTNLETPISPSLPLSNYPCFNVHPSYAQAAVDAGFDVFSLANNHSFDQGLVGVKETQKSLKSIPQIYFSGLKDDIEEDIIPIVIENEDWKILFLAITEIMNYTPSQIKQINYINPDKESRKIFLDKIKQFNEQYEHDIFILSIHTFEPEYITTISESKQKWFQELSKAGVDIVWGNHPHVLQKWETYLEDPILPNSQKTLHMFSLGNFISGQRYTPNLNDPSNSREYTGDSVLIQTTFIKEKFSTGYLDFSVIPIPITHYTDPNIWAPVVKVFTNQFISSLQEPLQNYYYKRYKLLEEYLPLLPID